MSKSLTVLILGATGETGKHVLTSALATADVKAVFSVGRKAPTGVSETTDGISKLSNCIVDFEKLSSDDVGEVKKLKDIGADAVLIALGTTKATAGSMEKFIRIDREYVLAAAKAARVEGKDQTVVYCSSGSASSTSLMPYSKSKGLTEEGLASLGYSDAIVFRPGLLIIPGGRTEHRFAESIAAKATGFLSLFSPLAPHLEIKTPILGAAMVKAAVDGQSALEKASLGKKEMLAGHAAWTLSNKDAQLLGAPTNKL